MRLFAVALFVLGVALLVGVTRPGHANDAPITIIVLTGEVPQGGAAFLLIDAPGANRVTVQHGLYTYPPERRLGSQWECVVGVPANAPAGRYELLVEAETDEGTRSARTAFTITKRTFPTQRLRLPATEEDKYAAASARGETRLIDAALNRPGPRRWHDGFRLPAAGRVSTAYGTRRYRNGVEVARHTALDIAAPRGTPVYAAATGKVTLVRSLTLHGRTVVVNHGGGVATLYLHLADFAVKDGDLVAAGQLLGHVGTSGVATGPHLHYALYIHGTPVDPALLKEAPDGW
jgi:murein DD-endopeptidase MepM/ murein hydrolase activator NlpD